MYAVPSGITLKIGSWHSIAEHKVLLQLNTKSVLSPAAQAKLEHSGNFVPVPAIVMRFTEIVHSFPRTPSGSVQKPNEYPRVNAFNSTQHHILYPLRHCCRC